MYLSDVIRLDGEYLEDIYQRYPIDLEGGKGATCWDGEGREYIDLTSGSGGNLLGYNHPDWVAAVTQQAGTLAHTSNLFYTRPQVQLAKTLCERTGLQKAVFSTSGRAAVEVALLAARRWGGKKRPRVLVLEGGYYSRLLANSFSQQIVEVQWNDVKDLKSKVDDTICALLLECVQGEEGVRPLSEEFSQACCSLRTEKNVLLLVDEVATGLGRTGRFLCASSYGILPDGLVLGGGLGGGLPLAVTLLGKTLEGMLKVGDYGSTFGGNPLAATGAKAVLGAIDGKLLDQVTAKGGYFAERLQTYPGVKHVSGKGLLLGLGLEDGYDSQVLANQAVSRGILLQTAGPDIKLQPPLTITYEEIDLALKRLEEIFQAQSKELEEKSKEE